MSHFLNEHAERAATCYGRAVRLRDDMDYVVASGNPNNRFIRSIDGWSRDLHGIEEDIGDLSLALENEHRASGNESKDALLEQNRELQQRVNHLVGEVEANRNNNHNQPSRAGRHPHQERGSQGSRWPSANSLQRQSMNPPQWQPTNLPQRQPMDPPQRQPTSHSQRQHLNPPRRQPTNLSDRQSVYSAGRQPSYSAERQPSYSAERQPAYSAERQPAYSAERQPIGPPQRQPVYPPQGQSAPGRQPVYPTERQPTNPPQQSLDELLVTASIEAGRKAFHKGQHAQALDHFREAQSKMANLPSQARRSANKPQIEYYVAVCLAYSTNRNLEVKEQAVAQFLEYYEDPQYVDGLQIAHAYHILAQLQVQTGDLNKAFRSCDRVFRYTGALGENDQRKHEPVALLTRVHELQNKSRSGLLSRYPESWWDWLKHQYSYLRPIGKGQPAELSRQPGLPIGMTHTAEWRLPRFETRDGLAVRRAYVPSKKIDKKTRMQWLKDLKLSCIEPALTTAIVDGDYGQFSDLISRGTNAQHAIHIAALFGEMKIAEYLLSHGGDGREVCRTAKLAPKRHKNSKEFNEGVTPMHLAIAGQNIEMVRLLGKNDVQGTALDMPARRYGGCAAPRWLLSEMWLERNGKDANAVVYMVDTLLTLPNGWNINAALKDDGKTMLDFANKLPNDHVRFKSAIIRDLKKRGAKSSGRRR